MSPVVFEMTEDPVLQRLTMRLGGRLLPLAASFDDIANSAHLGSHAMEKVAAIFGGEVPEREEDPGAAGCVNGQLRPARLMFGLWCSYREHQQVKMCRSCYAYIVERMNSDEKPPWCPLCWEEWIATSGNGSGHQPVILRYTEPVELW